MAFLERGILRAKSGRIELGADVVIRRTAANRLDIDDAVQVSGTANVTGAITADGGVASAGTVTVTGRLVAPHGTASPTVAANGQIVTYTKAAVNYVGFQIGGTPHYIAFPVATHGTVTVTVGGTP